MEDNINLKKATCCECGIDLNAPFKELDSKHVCKECKIKFEKYN